MVAGLDSVIEVDAYYRPHLCPENRRGRVLLGQQRGRQSGIPATAGLDVANPTPTEVNGLPASTSIELGGGHTCAVSSDNTARCWGRNLFGQLGNPVNVGTFTPNPTPSVVSGLSGVAQLHAGDAHTCATTSAGVVSCWGMNTYGQLGTDTKLGSTQPTSTPSPVADLPATESTRRRQLSCLRHCDRRPASLLGLQPVRAARLDHATSRQHNTAACRRTRSRRADRRRSRPDVRAHERAGGVLLGLQPVRASRQRAHAGHDRLEPRPDPDHWHLIAQTPGLQSNERDHTRGRLAHYSTPGR